MVASDGGRGVLGQLVGDAQVEAAGMTLIAPLLQ